MKKWVYLFTEGNANMRELLGGKGANLAEMTNIGLPVPQGFTITTEACTQYYEDGREINEEIQGQINEYITKMEEITGKKFGDHENPLLVSVRSGARASMPGINVQRRSTGGKSLSWWKFSFSSASVFCRRAGTQQPTPWSPLSAHCRCRHFTRSGAMSTPAPCASATCAAGRKRCMPISAPGKRARSTRH